MAANRPELPALNWSDLDRRAVDTVRVLAMDAVEKSGNGHPGTAMSLAPVAYLLFNRVMRHNPADPNWAGRDRFVLSAGHSSLTLYIQLFLSGYPLALDDLKALRQWGSLTPGHPEHGHTPGVETTTGPLGQGLGNAVGMAMAARRERGLFDPEPDRADSPFRHDIWCIASDGDIEEGIAIASRIGDDYLQKQARGYAVPDSFNHGTSAQRVRWLKRGFEKGDPEYGDTFSPDYNRL